MRREIQNIEERGNWRREGEKKQEEGKLEKMKEKLDGFQGTEIMKRVGRGG